MKVLITYQSIRGDFFMPKKPLIAIISNNDDDIYCFRKELIDAILKNNYDILLSCPYGEKFELMKDYKWIYDNPEINRIGPNVIDDFKLFVHYFKLLKKYKPDILLTFTSKPNVYANISAQLLKIPYIPNVTGLGSVLKKSFLFQKFFMFLYKIAFKKANCIMFQNIQNYDLAKKHNVVNSKYCLIPGSGVDVGRYPLMDYPDGGDGINGKPVVFNYIGRVLNDKGVDNFIEAAKIIKNKYPNTEFNILGFIEPSEKHYEKELKELEEKKIIFYRGSQKDVRPWIKRSHAIIHPSIYGEGVSNVLLENASSGRPIITTDNIGCKDTVINGITGLVYHGGCVEDLVSNIETFITRFPNEQRKQMGLYGREKIKNEFNRDYVIKKYLLEIKRLVKTRRND